MPFLDEDGVTRLTEDYLDIFASKNSLDATKLVGTIPSANLPSYVDDVLEYNGIANFPATGESGKIYVDTTDNNTYRWTGSAYVSISNPLDYATQNEAEAGVDNTKVMTPLRSAQQLAAKTDSALSSSSNNPVRNSAIKQALDAKLDVDDYRDGMTWGELEGAITWGDLEHDLSETGTTYTDTYHLTKPGLNSDAGIGPINDNMDSLDDILADIDDAIEGTQSSIAMIESSTAQTNHVVGSYFMLDNVLHKATSAIASGENIVSGSNATPITIEQALSALNSSVSTLQDSIGKWHFSGNGDVNTFDVAKSSQSNGTVYTDYSIISGTLGTSTLRIWRDGRIQFYDNGSQITLKFG